MKIQCAKKFNSLDSMITDMENALDEAEVHSSEDITAAEDDDEIFTDEDANDAAWDIILGCLETFDSDHETIGENYGYYQEEYLDFEENPEAMEKIDDYLDSVLNYLIDICKNKGNSSRG